MAELVDYLRQAVKDRASDLFIVAGGPVRERMDKHVLPLDNERMLPQDTERLISDLYALANRPMEGYFRQGSDEFSFSVPGVARFRVSAYRQRGSLAAVVRIVQFEIPNSLDLGIPEAVMSLADAGGGLVIFAGASGCGKSTTQACVVDRINRSRDCHIITLEDPIEYLHRHQRSVVSQQEIAIDAGDLLTALRLCLRQSPDVIVLGELRNYEVIHTAMTAAENGRLVLAAHGARGTAAVLDRLVEAFPEVQQELARDQLSRVLHAVVSQQLLPSISSRLMPAFELLRANAAVRSLIRESKTHLLEGVILSGAAEGMMVMDQSILNLFHSGWITKETALLYADKPDQLRRRI